MTTADSSKAETVTVGGTVDETRISLALYGTELEPADITRVLKVEPSSSRRRGDARPSKSAVPYKTGAWFLSAESRAPDGPESLIASVLDRLPSDETLWVELAARYEIQLRIAVFLEAFNRGFDLSPEMIARISRVRAVVVFDIYANLDDDHESQDEPQQP
jgi:hypothetical protein